MSGRQILEMLARLPARVWLQAIVGLIGFVVLAVLGFAVIAGVAAAVVLAIFGLKAKSWLQRALSGAPPPPPPSPSQRKVIDVQYEIVDRSEPPPRG